MKARYEGIKRALERGRLAVLTSFIFFAVSMSSTVKAAARTGSGSITRSTSQSKHHNQLSKTSISNKIIHKKVDIEIIILNKADKKNEIPFMKSFINSVVAHANPAASRSSQSKESTVKKIIKQVKYSTRSKKEKEKSIANDLLDFEKEAEQEVKQSLDGLADSLKGEKGLGSEINV
jgi:hypothetical protein